MKAALPHPAEALNAGRDHHRPGPAASRGGAEGLGSSVSASSGLDERYSDIACNARRAVARQVEHELA